MSLDEIYKDFFISLYKNPKNYGKLKDVDVQKALANRFCGDALIFYLKLDKDRKKVEEARFEGKGCVISIVSASMLTEYIKGKSIKELEELTPKKLFEIIGVDLSTNPSRAKCALLSLNLLKESLKDLKNKNDKN